MIVFVSMLRLPYASATAEKAGPFRKSRIIFFSRSVDWYVRQNAARSLKTLGVTWTERGPDASMDRYAAEMLEYILGVQPAAAGEKKESEALAAV